MSNMVLRELPCDQKALGSIVDWARENPPQWDKYTLVAWDLDQLEKVMPFVESHYWSDRESVNVFNVIGTLHPDYIGLSWREFLHQGKRMPVNQDLLRSNPIYYSETQVKQPSMLYISLDGKSWYINGDGNHRTCLARFHFARMNALGLASEALVHGVTVDDYRVNWRLFDAYQSLNNALLKSKKIMANLRPNVTIMPDATDRAGSWTVFGHSWFLTATPVRKSFWIMSKPMN